MKLLNGTKFSHSIWVLSGLMLSGLLARAGISLAAEGTWTYKADMPTARTMAGGGVVDGKIYVLGGALSNFSITPAVEMYDPTVDRWTKMENMPSGRCGPATCTLDGKIYLFGGVSPNPYSAAKKNVYIYDPEIDTWTPKADMPYAIAWCGIAVVDGTIYLIGGMLSASTPPVPTVMAYNAGTESWTRKADMPTARGALSACVVDGKIYAIGGATEDWQVFAYKHVEVYDPSMDTWIRESDMPTQRWGLGTCLVDGRIYAIGGRLGSDVCAANEVYDPITDAWTTKSAMQQKRNGAFVCSIGDKIYAIGGVYVLPQETFLSTTEEYDTGLGVPPPDFNADEIVNFKDFCRLAQCWRENESSVDISPGPFGDDIVDSKDLAVLGEYWLKEVLAVSLIAYWKLDETQGGIAHDSIGGEDGFGPPDLLWQPQGGKIGGALELDGIDDLLFTTFPLNPADACFTVSAWVKGCAPGQVIISQSGGANWLLADPATGTLMTELKGGGRFDGPLSSQAVITDGYWHRVALTWDGSNRILYVDGVEAAKDTQTALVGSTGGLYFGVGKDLAAASFFSGLIDDIRIYDRAVTP